MKKKGSHNFMKLIMTLMLTAMSLYISMIQDSSAIDVNSGIYMMPENSDKIGQYFPNGYTSHVFNKYLDSQEKCRSFLYLNDIQGYLYFRAKINTMSESELEKKEKELISESNKFSCISDLASDERNFIGIGKLISAPKKNAEGIYYIINTFYTDLSYLSLERSMGYGHDSVSHAEEKDIFQIKVFVHDNATAKARDTIKDTKVIVTLKDNVVTAKVGNSQVFFDNGTENVRHTSLKEMFELQTYFCDPYSSWQKGLVENTNKLIRQYLPRYTDMSKLSEKELYTIQEKLNNRPRKKLGYKTPNQVYALFIESGRI